VSHHDERANESSAVMCESLSQGSQPLVMVKIPATTVGIITSQITSCSMVSSLETAGGALPRFGQRSPGRRPGHG
jgi:hypothetical protein